MRLSNKIITIICIFTIMMSFPVDRDYQTRAKGELIPFTIYSHDIGNFSLNVDDGGGNNGGWGELKFPKSGNNHLNKAWLAVGNATEVVCGGGAGEFSAVDFAMHVPGGEFDLDSSANFTGTLAGVTLNVHQRVFMNTNITGAVGHNGHWLVAEYTIKNTDTSKNATGLYLMQYTDWKVNQTNTDSGYLRFDDKNMSVVYDITTNFSYYMATAQLSGLVQGYNAGPYDILLHGGDDSTVYSEMSSPTNDGTNSTDENWYTDLVADLGDLGPGESAQAAFVFLAGNSTDELNASYNDAKSAYFAPELTAPAVSGGAWKTGFVQLSTVAQDTAPGKVVSVEFEYSANSTNGQDGAWYPCDGSPVHAAPWQVLWNSSNATTTTDGSVWVRARAADDYGRSSPWRVTEAAVDNEAPSTSDDYDGLWHTSDFTVSLSPDDHGGSGVGPGGIYYKLNGGALRNVSADGQPKITNEDGNNTIEYWSIDAVGIMEQPSNMLADIRLDKTAPAVAQWMQTPVNVTQNSTGALAIVVQFNDTVSGVSTVNKPGYSYRFGSDAYSAYQNMTPAAGSPPAEFWKFNISEPAGGWKVYRGLHIFIRVKAMDDAGNEFESGEYIELIDGDNIPPTIEIIEPEKNEWYNKKIIVNATAFDSDGNITSVFFDYSADSPDGISGTWIGLHAMGITEPPYSVNWFSQLNIIQDELVWVRARAWDNDGSEALYSVIPIKVDNALPEVESVQWSPAALTSGFEGALKVTLEINDTGCGLDYGLAQGQESELYPGLSYRIGSGVKTSYLTMTKLVSDYSTWSYNIPAPAGGWKAYEGDMLAITFKVNDRLGNAMTTGEYNISIEKPVFEPFLLNHTPITSAYQKETIGFKAEVAGLDDTAQIDCYVFYRYDKLEQYSQKQMVYELPELIIENVTDKPKFVFETELTIPEPYPSSESNPKLYYYIWAGNSERNGTHPATAPAANPHVINIFVNKVPLINHTPPKFALVGRDIGINAKVLDDNSSLFVKLYYKNVGATGYDIKDMEIKPFSEMNTYSAEIPAQDVEGRIDYYIQVYDGYHTVYSPLGYYESPYSFKVYESERPKIIHEPMTSININRRIQLNAFIYDNDGIVSATVYYKKSELGDFIAEDMERYSGTALEGTYTAELPKQNYTTTIYYYISATDGLNTGTFPWNNASTEPIELKVLASPGEGPEILGFAPNQTVEITAGESITFNITVVDPNGDSRDLKYQWYVNSNPVAGAKGESFTFKSGTGDKGKYSILVKVSDADGEQVSFGWVLTIKPDSETSGIFGKSFGVTSLILTIIAAILAVLCLQLFFRRRLKKYVDEVETAPGSGAVKTAGTVRPLHRKLKGEPEHDDEEDQE